MYSFIPRSKLASACQKPMKLIFQFAFCESDHGVIFVSEKVLVKKDGGQEPASSLPPRVRPDGLFISIVLHPCKRDSARQGAPCPDAAPCLPLWHSAPYKL